MTKFIAASLLALLAMLGGLLKSIDTTPQQVLGANPPPTFDSANMTSSVLTLTGGSTTPQSTFKLGNIVVGPVTSTAQAIANANRKFGQIQNYGNAPAYCVMNSTSTGLSSTTFGFILNVSSTPTSIFNVQPTGGNMYVGQIWCVAGTNTTTIAIEEAN